MSKINIDELLKILPKLIRENDTVKGAIISALSGVVATHEDIVELTRTIDKKFESMDKRFEAIQQQMDKRFESMDKRFESMDKRFEAIQQQMERRTELVDKRFEAIQQQMERRTELVDERFEAMQQQMERRTELVDERFEAMQKQMNDRFQDVITQMNRGFEEARKDREKLEVTILSISSRSGKKLEDLILNLLSDKLIQENIDRSNISREKLVDLNGNIFLEDYRTDIDVVVQDGKTLLMEVKSTADNRDIFHLLKKGELFQQQFDKEYDGLILACLEINRTNFELAIKHGINVIAGEIA
jgi:hypothetical protein